MSSFGKAGPRIESPVNVCGREKTPGGEGGGKRMASSPTSIENQIDSFLEQFKRSASRVMEDTGQRSSYNASSISRSRSGNLDLEILEAEVPKTSIWHYDSLNRSGDKCIFRIISYRQYKMEVAAAEREAREVLHTLLAVERLEPAQTSIKKVAQEELDKSGASFDKLSSNLPPQMYQKILLQGLDHRNHVAEIIDEVIDDPAISDTKLADNMEQEHEPTRETATKESKVPSKKKQATKCKLKKNKVEGEPNYDPTKLEDSAVQVLERFKRGCECQDDQCFIGLSPEAVYRHRLNIAELTKAEHDMYLMGVTMACLTNPYHTAKHTERRRLRAQYVYQGRRVCLDAFLYLENCTHYQIKRIRKHLIMHGVTPRVHGNHGKVPHNTFSLDIYKIATEFLKDFVKKQEAKQKTNPKNSPLHLSPDITRKTVHDLYSEYCRKLSLDIKIMGYSTFRRFMKVQFPQVKFAKLEFVVRAQNTHSQCGTKTEPEKRDIEKPTESTRLVGDNGDLVPVVLTGGAQHNGTYFLTPVNKLQEGVSYQLTTGGLVVNRTSLHGTMENTSTI